MGIPPYNNSPTGASGINSNPVKNSQAESPTDQPNATNPPQEAGLPHRGQYPAITGTIHDKRIFDTNDASASFLDIYSSENSLRGFIFASNDAYYFTCNILMPAIGHCIETNFSDQSLLALKRLPVPQRFQNWNENIDRIHSLLTSKEFKDLDPISKLKLTVFEMNKYLCNYNIVIDQNNEWKSIDKLDYGICHLVKDKTFLYEGREIPVYFITRPFVRNKDGGTRGKSYPVGAVIINLDKITSSTISIFTAERGELLTDRSVQDAGFAASTYKASLDIKRMIRDKYGSAEDLITPISNNVLIEELDHTVQHSRLEAHQNRRILVKDYGYTISFADLLLKDNPIKESIKTGKTDLNFYTLAVELIAAYQRCNQGDDPLIELAYYMSSASIKQNTLDPYSIVGKTVVQSGHDEVFGTNTLNLNALDFYNQAELAAQGLALATSLDRFRAGLIPASNRIFTQGVGSYTLQLAE